ncbi:hypothetical protein BKA70DRAFT_68848 [Coprinopsis sp. MPI-PUGE-AT-0042]|nr:hypothetical protein BKA70DRAFT_68848 [Coprinopsis sp. MPI-PUGE-AT-0042]
MAFNPYASAQEQVLQGLMGADIIPLILQHLWTMEKESNANLRNAALTCKAFSKPALDLLWRSLASLDPLLMFVTDLNESAFLPDEGNESPPSRFDLYRKRVRKFMPLPPSHPSAINSEAACKVALHMCHMLRGEHLLPNLKRLWMYPSKDSNMNALIPFLLTPSLRNISLRGHTSPPDQLFPLVAKLCPSTEELTLGIGSEPLATMQPTVGSIPLEYLFGMKQLRTLSVTDGLQGRWSVRISSIRQLLSKLPCLTSLSFTVCHIEHDWATPTSQDSLMAPLKSFKLIYSSLPLMGLPSLYLLPLLTNLTINVHAALTNQEIASFISTAASHPRLSSYSLGGDDTDQGHPMMLNAEDIVPLFSSRTLKYIHIHSFILTHRDRQMPHSAVPSNEVVDIEEHYCDYDRD